MSKALPLRLALKSLFLLFLFLIHGLVQAQTLISYPVDNSATDYILIKAVGLPGGKSAVIYRDAGYNYKCSIVGSDGTLTGTFDFTSKMTLQNIPSRIEVNALGTSSGNIWITYTSSASDGPPSSINARYLVLDQSGNQVYSGTVNSSNLGTTLNRYIRMDQLSNGNVVMVWLQSDNMSGGYRIFQSNGTPVTNDASFAGPASSIFNSFHLFGGNMVAANPNGGFLITFYYYNGNFRGMLFDNNGVVQPVGGSNTFTIDPANYPSPVGSYTNISALGLSNGNYMIAWAQNSGGTNSGYYKIISATGSTVKAQAIFPPALQADISTYSWVGAAANNTSSSPGFVIADYSWQDYDDLKNPYAKAVYYNFDLSGNYLSSKDASPYFIADVYGPTVSVYSGNPSGVGVVYTHNKSYTPNGGSYTTSGVDIGGSLYGFGGASLSNNAALSNLTLSSGTLSPAFASGTTGYTVSVGNATSAITVTPTVAESNATVTVNNTPVTSGSVSGSIPLAVGANPITVKVTAQDGTTTSTYTITVTRAAAPGITTTGSFSAVSTTYGISSAYSSINVSGTNLTAGITATVSPSVFELSSDGSTFASSVSIGSSGSVSGTIYVRLKVNAAAGTYTTGSVSLSSTGANNPTLAIPSSTVNTAPLNIFVEAKSKSYGSANPALTTTYAGFRNGDNSSSLTTLPTLSTTATAGSTPGSYPITASGAAASNYTITYIHNSLTVTPAPLTITATNVNKTYGQTLTGGTGSTAFTQTGLVNGETIGSVSIAYGTGASATDAVGTYTDQVTPGAATGGTFNPANYSITYAKANIIVGAAPSTITFAALPAKTYGDADFAAGASSTNSVTPITYTSSNPLVATIVSGKIHIVGAGTTTITASQAADANHTAANDQQQTLTVNKAALTAIADPQTKVYGQANPVLTVHYSGFVGSDDASKLTTQATASTTALPGSPVGVYTITVSGGTADNYIINSYQTGSLTITLAPLTITANNISKVYGAGVPALTTSYSGFVNGDNASSLATAPTLSTTATAASAVGDYTITPSGAVASNYVISYATGTLSVTPAALTITADDKTKVYGAAVPALTASYSGFVNGDDASGLTTQPVLATVATVSSGVGTYAITASGAVASNYTISYVSGTLTVSAAQPVITFGSLPVKTYGDTDFDAGATSDNTGTPVTYSSDNTAVATIVNGKVRVVGAGTANITASQASDANHTAATDVIRQLTVNKAAITIAADAKNKTYGESDPALSYQITSGALVGTDNFTGSLVRDAGEDAGNYVINQGTLGLNGNYTLTYNSADLTINKAAITITAGAKTKTYGQSDPVLTYQVSSGALVGTDTFTGSLTRDPGENAGSYAIRQGTLALNTNYILTYTGASLIVNKASLTITADDKTKAYGQNNPVFTASYSGFVNGDDASGLAVQPTFITTAATTAPVGNYVITASGADDPNYTISYIAGNLSITPAALTITADNKIKVYGEADPVLTYSVTGLVSSDDLTGSLVRTPGNNAGVYTIQQGSLSATNNYVLSYQGANFTIAPKPVTVAADAQTKIYGQPDPLFTYSVSPVLLNGDVLNGALSRAAGEDAGSYAINQGSLNHPNYALSFTGNALNINKAAQQITWNQTLAAGCDGSTTIALTATASSGLPVSYQSANTAVATINGAQLQIAGPGSSMITATQPGNNNYLPAAEVQQELLSKLPAHLLVKRWDDVLVFDNSSNQYTAWQWYKNGSAINGATGQYYQESGKLNGDYYAVVKTAAGVTMQTCPVTITAGATFVPVSIFPNPTAPGQTITVKTGYSAAQLQGATIVVTNMLGAVVQTVQNVTPQTNITMPVAQGLYAIRLKLANGVTASINALVRPQ